MQKVICPSLSTPSVYSMLPVFIALLNHPSPGDVHHSYVYMNVYIVCTGTMYVQFTVCVYINYVCTQCVYLYDVCTVYRSCTCTMYVQFTDCVYMYDVCTVYRMCTRTMYVQFTNCVHVRCMYSLQIEYDVRCMYSVQIVCTVYRLCVHLRPTYSVQFVYNLDCLFLRIEWCGEEGEKILLPTTVYYTLPPSF